MTDPASTPPPPGPGEDPRRPRIEARFGAWNRAWQLAAETTPEYLDASLELDSVAERGGRLSPKVRALVGLVLAAAVTHLSTERMRRRMREALDAGASPEEIIEVLVVAATVGVHGMNADVLAEVLAERGSPEASAELAEHQVRIRDEYVAVRGYWRDFLDETLRLAPEFLETYLEFSGAPWRVGVLEPKVREFLYLAFDTAPTHLHMTGLRIHMNNALDHGASVGEIVEVMALAAAMGLETLERGMPLLAEELDRRESAL
ncbi:MAG: carboxymuconolactone decarboxylase family protein [Actinomycetales bacterium]|nr:carboxymuconolactone decarboxylase family protein [Actinomycetales bacterium]